MLSECLIKQKHSGHEYSRFGPSLLVLTALSAHVQQRIRMKAEPHSRNITSFIKGNFHPVKSNIVWDVAAENTLNGHVLKKPQIQSSGPLHTSITTPGQPGGQQPHINAPTQNTMKHIRPGPSTTAHQHYHAGPSVQTNANTADQQRPAGTDLTTKDQ